MYFAVEKPPKFFAGLKDFRRRKALKTIRSWWKKKLLHHSGSTKIYYYPKDLGPSKGRVWTCIAGLGAWKEPVLRVQWSLGYWDKATFSYPQNNEPFTGNLVLHHSLIWSTWSRHVQVEVCWPWEHHMRARVCFQTSSENKKMSSVQPTLAWA